MWPLLMQVLRRNAPFITLPFAAVVGYIGYHVENLISDRFTPFSESIQEKRTERQADEQLVDPTHHEKLKLSTNVLGRNLPPSLQEKK